MKRLVQPSAPAIYWIREELRRCAQCQLEYRVQFAHGNEVVKFVEVGGREERWLPTFEAGGYLDLLERLVPGFKREQSITMQVAKKFEVAFELVQERSRDGRPFSVAVGAKCPRCGASQAEQIDEQILASPQLEWLKYFAAE